MFCPNSFTLEFSKITSVPGIDNDVALGDENAISGYIITPKNNRWVKNSYFHPWCIWVYGYMGIWVLVYGYMGMWVYVYMCIWVYGYMCKCIFVYMCMCVCVCVYVCIEMLHSTFVPLLTTFIYQFHEFHHLKYKFITTKTTFSIKHMAIFREKLIHTWNKIKSELQVRKASLTPRD